MTHRAELAVGAETRRRALELSQIAVAQSRERLPAHRIGLDRPGDRDYPARRAAAPHLNRAVDDHRQSTLGVQSHPAGELQHRIEEGLGRQLVLRRLKRDMYSGLAETRHAPP